MELPELPAEKAALAVRAHQLARGGLRRMAPSAVGEVWAVMSMAEDWLVRTPGLLQMLMHWGTSVPLPESLLRAARVVQAAMEERAAARELARMEVVIREVTAETAETHISAVF